MEERPGDREGVGAVSDRSEVSRALEALLFLARADLPPDTVVFEPLDLRDLLPAIAAQVAPLAAARAQTVALAPLPPLTVLGNEDQLIRLILNLLDNALCYTPPGGRIALDGARDGAALRWQCQRGLRGDRRAGIQH